jgi:Ca2+-dependent lipid-binding protein
MENGNSGYVLKPTPMLKSPPEDFLGRKSPLGVLRIKIISAWQLPRTASRKEGDELDLNEKGVSDPFVRVAIVGAKEDTRRFHTRTVYNNGFNPNFDQTFTFELYAPEVALLLLEVWDKDKFSKDDLLGYAGCSVSALRKGYRAINLLGKSHNQLEEASLFVHVETTF